MDAAILASTALRSRSRSSPSADSTHDRIAASTRGSSRSNWSTSRRDVVRSGWAARRRASSAARRFASDLRVKSCTSRRCLASTSSSSRTIAVSSSLTAGSIAEYRRATRGSSVLYLRLLVAALFASVRARRDLVLENLALRHQLAVYTRGRRRPRLRCHDRRFWSLLARGWSGWRDTLVMVEPDTVVRWHRSAWRAYWRWKSRRGPGRSHIPAEWQRLILRIATENPRWGAVRIVGELRAPGFDVSARTVSRYRQQARLIIPVRSQGTPAPASLIHGTVRGR